MKILYFFLYLWVIFALLDPDPDPHNPVQNRVKVIRIRNLDGDIQYLNIF
jgi:hypothetical protein